MSRLDGAALMAGFCLCECGRSYVRPPLRRCSRCDEPWRPSLLRRWFGVERRP